MIITIILLCLGIILALYGIASILYLIINYGKKAINVNDNSDKQNNYYRDLLSNYSIATLSYMIDEEKNLSDAVTATMISLNNKGFINLTNEGCTICEGAKLSPLEDFIVNHYQQILRELDKYNFYTKNKNEYKKELIRFIEDDIQEKGLGQHADYNFNFFVKSVYVVLVLFAALAFFGNAFFVEILTRPREPYENIILYIFFFLFLLLFILYIVNIKLIQINKIVKTEKGKDIIAKLYGLKKFLLDFSQVGTESIEDVKLRNDYIPYYIMFDLKGNLDDENTINLLTILSNSKVEKDDNDTISAAELNDLYPTNNQKSIFHRTMTSIVILFTCYFVKFSTIDLITPMVIASVVLLSYHIEKIIFSHLSSYSKLKLKLHKTFKFVLFAILLCTLIYCISMYKIPNDIVIVFVCLVLGIIDVLCP